MYLRLALSSVLLVAFFPASTSKLFQVIAYALEFRQKIRPRESEPYVSL